MALHRSVRVGRVPALQGWPDETNTGIAGVGLEPADLTDYTGYGAFSEDQNFTERAFRSSVMGNGYVRIDAGCDFTASRSYFNSRIDCDGPSRSLTLIDCTIDGSEGHLGVGYGSLNLIRCDISNALIVLNTASNIYAEDCFIRDPWIAPDSIDHINPVFNGGGTNLHFKHCAFRAQQPDTPQGGGVTSSFTLLPDFAAVQDVLVEDCYFHWTTGAYGSYWGWQPGKDHNDDPGNATQIVVRNNVFERGPSGLNGALGPHASWQSHATNSWTNNRYDDGVLIPEP